MGRMRNGVIAIGMIAALSGTSAMAETFIPGGDEQVKIYAGGVLAWINSSAGINGTSSIGSQIDLDGPISNKSANNFILGATWRIGARHRLSGMYFTTRKERSLSFDQQVTIGDDTLVPPTTLASDARNRFLLADYRYSFVKNDNIELSGVIGAYINKFTIDLTGTATVQNVANGSTTTTTRSVMYRPGVTVPMPLIGGSIDWFVSPRWMLGASLTGMKAKIGDVDGSIYVAAATAEYMVTRHVGAGLSFMHARLNVDVTKPNFNGTIRWQNDNLLGYVLVKF